MQICYKDILADGEVGQFIVTFSHPQSCSKTALPKSKYNWLSNKLFKWIFLQCKNHWILFSLHQSSSSGNRVKLCNLATISRITVSFPKSFLLHSGNRNVEGLQWNNTCDSRIAANKHLLQCQTPIKWAYFCLIAISVITRNTFNYCYQYENNITHKHSSFDTFSHCPSKMRYLNCTIEITVPKEHQVAEAALVPFKCSHLSLPLHFCRKMTENHLNRLFLDSNLTAQKIIFALNIFPFLCSDMSDFGEFQCFYSLLRC